MGSISEAAGPDCDDGGFTAVIDDDILDSHTARNVPALKKFCYLIPNCPEAVFCVISE